ncbi:target of Myb protein 1 isoform X2 [Ananas comosus]|uniref:Target of Myb protein 1 isoform X2 n=1 Tax=Ananas comosus TaxID=4615 RepID=A0A6P5FDF3_ANACO|nr:target of Myb protein 1 isoform X2 [Ananas comosus]
MSDNLMDKVSSLSERLKISGTEVGRKMSAGMSSMSFKVKEFFQGQNPAEKIVEEATSENMDGPDWSANLEICDMINSEKVNSVELIRGIKKRIMLKNPMVQYLALVLLETCVKNCEKAFSEVAAERVLDEMVKLIDDPQTVVNNRNKALVLIEAWGESGDELRYLPVYEETYKDDLTTTLVQQCQQSQYTIQRIIESAGDNEALLFEALNVNDEVQKVLSKYEEMNKPTVAQPEPEPAIIPVAVEPDESPRVGNEEDALVRKPAASRAKSSGGDDDILHDLDEMIFGKKGGSSTSHDHDQKKDQHKDDLISF